MPDGQDKSDDLIAELAKLMASNAGSAEPEARPAPKLVTLPEDNPAPPPHVRIPGMDAPVAAPAPVASAPQQAVRPAPNPAPIPSGVLRIPGMDQPAAAAPAPVVTAPSVAPARPAASFDFGTMPTTSTFKPEPMANWQDREIPRPVASRPAPVPVIELPKAAAQATARAVDPMAELEAEFAATRSQPTPAPVEPIVSAPRPMSAPAVSPMIQAAKASPAADNFDFDFGFDTEPPVAITPKASAPAPAPARPAPAPAPSSGDPIADLIAAELDSAEAEIHDAPEPAPQPAPRSFPQPAAAPAPRPPVNSGVFRGPAGPINAQAAGVRPEDHFGVAPVFGPTSKVPAQKPQAPIDRDPMDEIESLIGEAVRVELTSDQPEPAQLIAPAPVAREPQPAPIVPPLTAGLPPRRASLKDTEPQIPSAEAAILAAAAASGAEVGRIDSLAAEKNPYKRIKAKPERRANGLRPYIGMAVAGTLLLAAGFGLYWVLGMGRPGDTEAPVLQADSAPVKEAPPPAPSTTGNQGSVVFNELDGNSAAAIGNEQLVSRDDSEATSVADVAQTVGDGGSAASESELANRKVRTVTVRPDGTIVSGDEAVAGNEELPVDRPAVPDLPGSDVQPSELLAAVPGAVDANSPAIADPNQVSALIEAPAAGTAPAAINSSIVAPIPVGRPADRSVLGGGANQRTAVAAQPQPLQTTELLQPQQPVAVPQPASTASVGGSGPYVQLSSQPTEPDAQASLRATQNRLSGLLAGRNLAIRPVDLGAKGTWYRVVLPVDSFPEATQTCASLKANGVDCVPIGG